MKRIVTFLIVAFGAFLLTINFIVYKKVDNQKEIGKCIFDYQKNVQKNNDDQSALALKLTFYGEDKISDIYKVYVYQAIEVNDGTRDTKKGSNLPTVYSLKRDKGNYVVTLVEEPSDGGAYEESLRKMFPKDILNRLNSPLGFFAFRNRESFS